MGAWGCESSANDDCWDLLSAGNIHEMSQEDADVDLENIMKPSKSLLYPRNFVGVVTHILYQGLKVKKPVLKKAIKFCEQMLDKKNHPKIYAENVDCYDNTAEREQCVRQELKDLKKALKAGKGSKKHVKGLLERIEEGEGK